MQRIIENGTIYVQFMNSVFEAAQAVSASDDMEEKLTDIHNRLSRQWLELYQKHVGQYLAAPQLGLSREALQQTNASISAYHGFMGAAGDFFVMFSTPLKKSMDRLQAALQNEDRMNEGLSSAEDVYNLAVKILDKEYDDWLKSPEGVKSVAGLVEKFLEYRQSLNPVRETWLKSLSIPSKAEMEDVYKGIYELKKKSRQQEAVIREQNGAIKKLNVRIRKLEVALSEFAPQKKRAPARRAQTKKKAKAASTKRKKAI